MAVSGGADSLALALLAHDWCRTSGRDLLVLTVDHGLREASASEARHVAALMAARQIPCHILKLQNLSAGSALAARAREARYQALCTACRDSGIIDLLLGHHLRDQAETLLLRQGKSSGPAGLAGMAGVFLRDGVRLIRPLLATRHQELRGYLREHHVRWVEDPSNQDQRATRVRLRGGLTEEAIMALAAKAQAGAESRRSVESATAAWLAAHATIRPEGFAHLEFNHLEFDQRFVHLAAASCPPVVLSALIQMLAGLPYPPATKPIARLAEQLPPATLSGVRLIAAPRANPGFLLLREQSAIAPDQPAQAGAMWDRRFRIIHRGDLPDGTTIGPLGADAAQFRDQSDLPAILLRTLPAFRDRGSLLHVPFLPAGKHNPNTGTIVCFAPPRPAAGALFRAVRH